MKNLPAENVYSFTVKAINQKETSLGGYKNQVLLVVNTASKCGFTPQYKGLEELQQKYKDKNFTVLAFPCNQFGAQEPGNADEIKDFCETNYHISFPLFDKIEVNGGNTHPLYQFLKEKCPGLLGTKDIKWNFTKFLVNKDGVPVERYAPQTDPLALEKDIEKLL